MRAQAHKNPIDPLSEADAVITLLGRINIQNFPAEERIAVAAAQVEAIDDWLAAYLDSSLVGVGRAPSPQPGAKSG